MSVTAEQTQGNSPKQSLNPFEIAKTLAQNWSKEDLSTFVGLLQENIAVVSEESQVHTKSLSNHRLSNTRVYSIWSAIKGFCYNTKNPNYKNYGAKGVIVCRQWKNSFLEFYNWAMENGYTDTACIRRKDATEPFSPENCYFEEKKSTTTKNSKSVDSVPAVSLLQLWSHLKQSCQNSKSKKAKTGRTKGLSFYPGWSSFKAFKKWALETGYKVGASLVRKDASFGYEPFNCEWVVQKQPKLRSNTRMVTIKNVTKPIQQWAQELGITVEGLRARLKKGYSDDYLLKGRKILIPYEGELLTLKEISKKSGLSYATVYSRYSKSVDSNELVQPQKRNRKYFYGGETRTLKEWAAVKNISYSTLVARKNRYADMNNWFTPVRSRRARNTYSNAAA